MEGEDGKVRVNGGGGIGGCYVFGEGDDVDARYRVVVRGGGKWWMEVERWLVGVGGR